jgi:tetratricopeptide (TPR) repeat protein
VARPRRAPASYNGQQSFGDLLRWHLLDWGTRPQGSPDHRGIGWGKEEFANAVLRSVRAVEFWLQNRHLPPDLSRIVAALFGNNPRYADWRVDLQTAWREPKKLQPKGEPQNETRLRKFAVPPRIVSFTGRQDELKSLAVIFDRNAPASATRNVGRAAVHGLPGGGKTALAIEYAYVHRSSFDGIWWCSAETPVSLVTSLAALAVELGAVTKEEPDLEKASQAALHALARREEVWLLIYDNAPSPNEIASLLPQNGAHLLITSRFSDWSEWAEQLALDVPPLHEAIALLHHRAGRTDKIGAQILAAKLGNLPLALDHAAAYCKFTHMKFADYAARVSALIEKLPGGVSYPSSIFATFSMAINTAASRCPAARVLATYLGFCSPERIPLALAEGAIPDREQRDSALLILTEVSLVKADPYPDRGSALTMHRLVQEVARAQSDEKMTEAAIETIIIRLRQLFPLHAQRDPLSWPQCEKLTPHVLEQLKLDLSWVAGLAQVHELLSITGLYFKGRALYAEARTLLQMALDITEQACGPDHLNTAYCFADLAGILELQGDYPGSQRYLERALEVYEDKLGRNHKDTAAIMADLGWVLFLQDDLTGAKRELQDALQIYGTVEHHDNRSVATVLTRLADVLRAQRETDAALEYAQRALRINETEVGPRHPDTAAILTVVAAILEDQDKFAEARTLLERAYEIKSETLGSEHPQTAQLLYFLASILSKMGDHEAASRSWSSHSHSANKC